MLMGRNGNVGMDRKSPCYHLCYTQQLLLWCQNSAVHSGYKLNQVKIDSISIYCIYKLEEKCCDKMSAYALVKVAQ